MLFSNVSKTNVEKHLQWLKRKKWKIFLSPISMILVSIVFSHRPLQLLFQRPGFKGVWTLGGEIWQKNANFGVSFWKTVILFGKTFYTIGLYANVPTKWHILFPSVNSIMAIFRTPKFGVFAILMMQNSKKSSAEPNQRILDVWLQYNQSAMAADNLIG